MGYTRPLAGLRHGLQGPSLPHPERTRQRGAHYSGMKAIALAPKFAPAPISGEQAAQS